MAKSNKNKPKKDTVSGGFSALAYQHLQSLVFSLGLYFKNPLNNILTTLVLAIAIALPLGFYVFIDNISRITKTWDNSVQIMLFLKQDVDQKTAEALQAKLEQKASIERITLITKEQALEDYQRLSGFNDVLMGLDYNPLPIVLLIDPVKSIDMNTIGKDLIPSLRELPEADLAEYDRQWVKKLFSLIEIFKRIVLIISALFALAVILIVGNTIRLMVFNRKDEIKITKLFGATDAFIRRPFLYTGFWHGLIAGIIAWAIITISLFLVAPPIDSLANLYSYNFSIHHPGILEVFCLLFISFLLGVIGSWQSVNRHLKEIEQA